MFKKDVVRNTKTVEVVKEHVIGRQLESCKCSNDTLTHKTAPKTKVTDVAIRSILEKLRFSPIDTVRFNPLLVLYLKGRIFPSKLIDEDCILTVKHDFSLKL